MGKNTFIFDLDGTLLDTSCGVKKAIDYTVEKLHLRPLTEQEKDSCIGPPIQNSFARLFGLSKEEADNAAAVFRNAYKDIFLFDAIIYDGVVPLLEKIRSDGKKTAVATYKREDYTLKLFEHFQLSGLFDVIHGSDFEGKLTKGDIMRLCISELKSDAESSVLIGDTVHDLKGAEELKTDFIGVTYGFGFHNADEIDKCNFSLASDTEQLYKIIREKY